MPFTGDGKAKAWPGAHFDDARNWALLEARVTHIFVAQPLRDRLMAYAQRTGVRDALRVRVSEVLAQPRGALPHDDHFHVRVACPAHMTACVENPARHTARAHGGHAARGGGHGEAHHGHAAPGHAAPAPQHAPSQAPSHAPAKPQAREAERDDEPRAAPAKPAPSRDAEVSTPRLGPVVPGYDSAVIPAPLDDDGT